jgi:hypothetical protein
MTTSRALRAIARYAVMVVAIGVGVTVFMVADVQLALVSISPEDPATSPSMAPQVRYFFIPVVASAIAVVAVIVNLLLSLVDRRSLGSFMHWLLLGVAYSLVASALPMRYLGVNGQMALLVGVIIAAASVLFVRRRYGARGDQHAV